MIVAALIFIGVLLRSQWAELRTQPWRFHGTWLTFSVGMMIASWVMEVLIWQHLLSRLGGHIGFWSAVRIWFLSAITRYVPGNIWQPLSMTMRCQTLGIRPEITIASVLLFQAIILIAAGPVAAIYFGWTGNYGLVSDTLAPWSKWLIALILMPVLLLLVRPKWFFAVADWGIRRLGRPSLEAPLSSQQLIGFLAAAMVHWAFWGAAFASLTFAINGEAANQLTSLWPHLVATFAIAYTIGFVSFITPSGFGAREGAFVLLLTPLLGSGATTLAALAMRILTVIGELLMALGCLFFEHWQTRRDQSVA